MRMIHICMKRTEKKKKIISFHKATNSAKNQNIRKEINKRTCNRRSFSYFTTSGDFTRRYKSKYTKKFNKKPFMFKENFLIYFPSLQKNLMIRAVL